MRDRVLAQTLAMEEDPLEDSTSATTRTVYGNVSSSGNIGRIAVSPSAPCPISRRFGPRSHRVSPVENGGKL